MKITDSTEKDFMRKEYNTRGGISIALLVLCLGLCAFGQNVRYSAPFPSVSSIAPPFLIANLPPNSPVLAVCNSPANALPCTNYATTFTSLGVACPNGAQDTPDPNPSACQSTGDAQGNIAFCAPVTVVKVACTPLNTKEGGAM